MGSLWAQGYVLLFLSHGALLIGSSSSQPRNALRRLRLSRPLYRGVMVESQPSSPSDMMYSSQPISFRGSTMVGLSSVLVTRILGKGSVMRKSSDGTMKLDKLAGISGGQYGREYASISLMGFSC
jgi:hypothetical protein